MAELNTTATARFEPEAEEDGFLSVPLALRFGGGVNQNGIGFQLFPAVNALLFGTNGDITVVGKRAVEGINDVITFSGTDTGGTAHPVTGLGPYDLLGDAFSLEGKTIAPSIWLDSDIYTIKASQPLYGAYKVSYSTDYLQCYWKHNQQRHGGIFYKGVILAMYKGSVATLEFNDGNDDEGNFEKTEIYRVTSKYIADSQGAWEYPPGWPEDPVYPGYSGTDAPDTGSYQVLERVHFIGYVNKRGSQTYDQFFIHIERPFEGDNSHVPQYELTLNRNPPDGFEEAFSDVNFNTITTNMRKRFRNLTVA